VEHHPQSPTIAILGCDTVVGRSLSVLLESSGYQTTLLDSHPTGIVDELLEGANLLILTPRVDQGVREAFLGAMGKSTPQKAEMPVIALHTDLEKELPEKEGVISVPWPCETKDLVERIEAALLDAPAASATSNNSSTQARTG
jgi:FixJ family two-component response regulator